MQVKLERQLQAEDLNIVYESSHQYDVILLLRNIFYQNHIFQTFLCEYVVFERKIMQLCDTLCKWLIIT